MTDPLCMWPGRDGDVAAAGTGRRRAAFTLIELVAVMLILALLIGAATLALGGVRREAEMSDVIDRLRAADETARRQAHRLDEPAELVFDLRRNRIEHSRGRDRRGGRGDGHWTLPRGFSLERAWIEGHGSSSHQIAVGFSSLGHSPSYALAVRGPSPPEGDGRPRRLLLWAGLSGQMKEPEDESQLETILQSLGAGPDAD